MPESARVSMPAVGRGLARLWRGKAIAAADTLISAPFALHRRRPTAPAEDPCAMRERRSDRPGFWRLALGALGLFWVCVLLVLMS
jgi:hypothetical protein